MLHFRMSCLTTFSQTTITLHLTRKILLRAIHNYNNPPSLLRRQTSSTNLMSPGSSRGGGGGGGGATRTLSYATTDLCDAYINSPARLQAAEAGVFFDYGGVKAFHGQIETVRCFESNPMVRQTLSQPGNNRVLVVDGGGSKRVAIMGDQLASMAHENNWRGVIINGCIRDSKMISTIPVGVKALGTHPLKSLKDHKGERGGLVAFAGLEFHPGHWVYADEVRTNVLFFVYTVLSLFCNGGFLKLNLSFV